ncbi:hypothetical protein ACFVYG_36755 [Streptomyces sp. NPDC058256]|uniref:hypothetical protein n=1 Tax=Streptomyces sp. NPDC058256 TaxID=3346408 RepID=UPI0036E2BC50
MSDNVAGPPPDITTRQTRAEDAAVTTVTAHFKMVFICVTVITVLTLAASVYIGVAVAKPSDSAKSAMDTCSTLAKLGFGAIIGLLSGKAAQ